MTLDDIIRNRFSARAFEDTPVPESAVVAMAEAARWAPSACNSQTWRFIAVTDRARIQRLCDEGMPGGIGNKWLREAPLIIAGCSKLDIVANRFGGRVTGIDYYQIDLGIAMEHMVLKATELGLGTCWVGWISEERVKAILETPKAVRVLALLAVGYPRKPAPPKRARLPLSGILFMDAWNNPFPGAP